MDKFNNYVQKSLYASRRPSKNYCEDTRPDMHVSQFLQE